VGVSSLLLKPVYYLTGMGGRLDSGLGQGLLTRGVDVTGRELIGDFRALDFQNQVDCIANDLRDNFWHEDARVIANSFGAYLFLHAQAQLPPFIGRVLLLSPIIGEFANDEAQMNFVPPRAEKLFALAHAGTFPTPQQCEIHVGSEDWQSNPTNVSALGSILGIKVSVLQDAGHMLPKEYVGSLLDKWLR
jgi:predicted alpha/beta hydrolase family esterase